MLQIDCPWCGTRDENEFTCAGEAHIERPSCPEELSDYDWADYLYFRKNTKGYRYEQWSHTAGCRKWFNAVRDTITYEVKVIYLIGEDPPDSRGL